MKVHLAISTYRGFPRESAGTIRVAEECLRRSGVEVYPPDLYGSAMLADARNKILANRPPDADVTVFIDDDMFPEPMALVKLIEHTKEHPVVSAACTTRTRPVKLCIKYFNRESQEFLEMDDIPRNKPFLEEVAVGTAFLALRKDVIEQLIEQYLSAADWMEERRREFDRLHVRAELRERERARIEGIRRTAWEQHRQLKIFRFGKIDNEIDLGEDVTLCYRLMQLGIKVLVDPTIIVGHLGDYPYSLADYLSSDDIKQMQEAQRIYMEEAQKNPGLIYVPV